MRPTAYRPPAYPGVLALATLPDVVQGKFRTAELNIWVVLGIHVFLGILTVAMVYYIAWRLEMRWGWVPALAVALDPILLHHSTEMMTETLVTYLAVWTWALFLILVRPNINEVGRRVWGGMHLSVRLAIVLGLVLGVAVLTRPTMLPWTVLVLIALGFRGGATGNRVAIVTAAL